MSCGYAAPSGQNGITLTGGAGGGAPWGLGLTAGPASATPRISTTSRDRSFTGRRLSVRVRSAAFRARSAGTVVAISLAWARWALVSAPKRRPRSAEPSVPTTPSHSHHGEPIADARRRDAGRAPVTVPKAKPRRPIAVYECDSCGERAVGQQRCETCSTFMHRIGIGGECPACSEPIAVGRAARRGGRDLTRP